MIRRRDLVLRADIFVNSRYFSAALPLLYIGTNYTLSFQESPTFHNKIKTKGEKAINIKIPKTDNSVEVLKNDGTMNTEIAAVEKDISRRRTMSEEDLDGMRDLLLKSMIRKDRPELQKVRSQFCIL